MDKPPEPQTPLARAWKFTKRFGRGAVVVAGVAYFAAGVTALTRQYNTFLEYVTLPEAFYLELDLESSSLVERARSDPLALLQGGAAQLELGKALQVLDFAKSDPRVQGLLALLGGRDSFGGLAQVQELRNAIIDFRLNARGRAPAVCFSNSLGEGGANATAVVYLASCFDRAYVAPTGMVSLLGFDGTALFFKRLLGKIGVAPKVFRREEYKSAMAPLVGDKFDSYHRANTKALLGDLAQQVISGIAAGRRMEPSEVESAMSEAPLTAGRAATLGLIDGAAYRDQLQSELAARSEAARPALRRLREQTEGRPGQWGISMGRGSSGGDGARGPPQPLPPTMAQDKRRNPLTGGPAVAAQRYLASVQWQRMRTLRQRAAAAAAGGAGRAGGGVVPTRAAPPCGPGGGPEVVQTVGQREGHQPGVEQQAGGPLLSGSLVPWQQQQQQQQQDQKQKQQQLPAVVVVNALGQILQSAPPGQGGITGDKFVEGHKLVRALQQMRSMEHVKAVVLRVNSPGGSAVASDAIHRELKLLRESGRVVIASMADVAASGGYYISAPAHRILAQPGTITGSIGVIMSKVNLSEAAEKIGITTDTVKVGRNADWTSPFKDLTPEQEAHIDEHVEATYQDFLSRVAEGRGMSVEAVRRLAKGRVYTGRQAMEVGLVDEIGGLSRAVQVAKREAGLPDDPDQTQLLEWPPRKVPPALALLKSSGMIPAPDSDPAPAPPPAATLGLTHTSATTAAAAAMAAADATAASAASYGQQQLGGRGGVGGSSGGGVGGGMVRWDLALADARQLLHLFWQGPEGSGWGEYQSGSSILGAGGPEDGRGGSFLSGLAALFPGHRRASEVEEAAAAALQRGMDAGSDELAAAAALLAALPRGAARGLRALAVDGAEGRGPQMMCLEAEALAMCC